MRPTISFLSGEDKEKIHRAAFQILSEIGMKILQDEALALLKDAGCSVARRPDGENTRGSGAAVH